MTAADDMRAAASALEKTAENLREAARMLDAADLPEPRPPLRIVRNNEPDMGEVIESGQESWRESLFRTRGGSHYEARDARDGGDTEVQWRAVSQAWRRLHGAFPARGQVSAVTRGEIPTTLEVDEPEYGPWRID